MALRFRLLRFPVAIHPWFFLTAWLIGPRSQSPELQVLWIAMALIGVLAHELGHAAAARSMGMEPEIELWGLGGLTRWRDDRRLSRGRDALVTAAGPMVGIGVGVLLLLVSDFSVMQENTLIGETLRYATWVTLGWGVINLVPVTPLDGGRLVASLAGMLWPRGGPRATRAFSLAVAIGIVVWMVAIGSVWNAFVAVILVVVNYRALVNEGRSQGAAPVPTWNPAGAWSVIRSALEDGDGATARRGLDTFVRQETARFERTRDAGAAYNLACAYGLIGDPEGALSWLETSVRAGFSDLDHLDHDPDLAPLRSCSRFEAIRAVVEADFRAD